MELDCACSRPRSREQADIHHRQKYPDPLRYSISPMRAVTRSATEIAKQVRRGYRSAIVVCARFSNNRGADEFESTLRAEFEVASLGEFESAFVEACAVA